MLFNLDAPPAAVKEIERNMRINEDVLRYLTVRVEELEEGPSAMMQNRGATARSGDRATAAGAGLGDRRARRGDRDAPVAAGEHRGA